MKGEPQIIERLNEALFLELGAVNQYWVHYRLLEDWGYTKLAKKERAESIEEMHHADRLIARIIFLEGHPNLQSVAPLRIGQNVKEVLESDLAGEAYDQQIAEGNAQGNATVQAAIDALIDQTKSIERAVGSLKLNQIAFEGSDSLDAPDKVFK